VRAFITGTLIVSQYKIKMPVYDQYLMKAKTIGTYLAHNVSTKFNLENREIYTSENYVNSRLIFFIYKQTH